MIESGKKVMWLIAATLLTIHAFLFDRIYDEGSSVLSQYAAREEGVGVLWCVLALFVALFYCLYEKKYRKRIQKTEFVWAVLFAGMMLLGRSYASYDSWDLVFASGRQLAAACVAGIGWTIFFYRGLVMLTEWMENGGEKKQGLFDSKRLWRVAFLIILVCWIPYLVISLPGNVPHDGMVQLSMWFGFTEKTNHHPWLTTMLFGFLMEIGRTVNDNVGVFLIVVVQSLLCAGIYAYVCVYVNQYAGKWAASLTVFYFAILPVWGFYAASVIKDTLFTALFALYCCKTMDLFQKCCDKNDGNAGIADWIIYGLLNFLICAIRSEGICRVIPVCVLMCLAMRRGRRKMAVTALAVICVFAVYNMVALPWMGIGKAPGRDMASIPFQQTARYMRDYGWDIRPEEQAVLDRVFPEVSIAEQYQEELSDSVKNYAYAFGKEEILDYIRVWAAMGIRHSDVYIQATMNNAYGYFYPFHNTRVMAAYQNYIKEGLADLDIHYVMNKETRDALADYAELWRVFPGVSILSNPGTAGIVVLVIWMLLVKKRLFREMAVLSAAVLHLMVCVASPVNGFLRYAMPLMAALPVLIAWCWMRYKKTGVSLQFEWDIIY